MLAVTVSRTLSATVLVAFLSVVCTEAMTLNERCNTPLASNNSRRQLIGSVLSVSLVMIPSPSHAARGAAELDLEYYARDLFGGNKKEGSVGASPPPLLPPPRTLKEPLLSLLLSEDISCIPKQSLSTTIKSMNRNHDIGGSIEETIQERILDYRSKAGRSFNTRAPWRAESLNDQYYFDFTSYALWRTARDLLPNPVDRDAFVRLIGRTLYQRMLDKNLLPSTPTRQINNISASEASVKDILQVLQSFGFIKSYRLGEGNTDRPLFDELDDEALRDGASVDCLISIFEPATLGAALQITGEQSRFAPDYVGPTIAALWETYGLKCTWETFFVDNEYRPNPKDYFPNEQLLQFTISSNY